MTLSEIQRELSAITAHPLTDTNLDGIEREGGSVRFCVDVSELRDDLAEAKGDATRAQQDASEAEAEADLQRDRADKAEALLAEFKDSGGSLLEYARRAQEAEFQAREQLNIALDAQRKFDALRKRKGQGAALIRYAADVFRFIDTQARAGNADANKLIEALRSYSP